MGLAWNGAFRENQEAVGVREERSFDRGQSKGSETEQNVVERG